MFNPQPMQIERPRIVMSTATHCPAGFARFYNRTSRILPDNALQLNLAYPAGQCVAVDMTKRLWKDWAKVYEMMGHHGRIVFSWLPCTGKEDNDNDVADNAVEVDDIVDVVDIVHDVDVVVLGAVVVSAAATY